MFTEHLILRSVIKYLHTDANTQVKYSLYMCEVYNIINFYLIFGSSATGEYIIVTILLRIRSYTEPIQ